MSAYDPDRTFRTTHAKELFGREQAVNLGHDGGSFAYRELR